MFDHILSGNEQASRYGQKRDQCSIDQFTYGLEIRNETGWSERRLVLNQQVHIHPRDKKARRMVREVFSV